VDRVEHERGGMVMQGRIPGRLLAQFAPWHAKPVEAREALDNFEEDDVLEEE
jgi:hypothetical protein